LLAALERAINRNQATFAALPMHLLLGKEGVIARLRASGYRVDEPELPAACRRRHAVRRHRA
jgi:hypothetical protein